MLWEQMVIDPTRFVGLVHLVNTLFGGWEKYTAGPQQLDRDIHNLLEHQAPHLRLRHRDKLRACREFDKWGIPQLPWVCLIVRDGAYLPHHTYHSFRDCDVDTYAQAAIALAESGYNVFRMGAKVAKPFAAKHPRIFDYATNGMRSDFMDVYLGARCAFTVSTSTGWDAIPQVFRRPICYTNFPQFEYLPTWQPASLAIWKHLHKDGKRLSVAEIVKSGAGQFMQATEFEKAGIALIDNTAQEITDAVLEMAEWVEGRWCPLEQTGFWEKFPRSVSAYNSQPLHGKFRMRIGAKFLWEYDVQIEKDSGSDPSARRLEARSA
jgi:putative glycosyltransferase (TIGR04372 family)